MTEETLKFAKQSYPFRPYFSTLHGELVITDDAGHVYARCGRDTDAANAIVEILNDAQTLNNLLEILKSIDDKLHTLENHIRRGSHRPPNTESETERGCPQPQPQRKETA